MPVTSFATKSICPLYKFSLVLGYTKNETQRNAGKGDGEGGGGGVVHGMWLEIFMNFQSHEHEANSLSVRRNVERKRASG